MMQARRIITGGAIALVAGAVLTSGLWWLQLGTPAASPAAASRTTATVTRGPLVDTKKVTGTLSYGKVSELRPALSDAAAMVTWIAPVGSTVQRGGPLYRLNGQSTILFYGSAPQHRTLRFDPDTQSVTWVELEQGKAAVAAAQLRLTLEQERLADAEASSAGATARLADARSTTPATAEFIQLVGAVRGAESKLDRIRELASAQLTPNVEIAGAEAELAAARAGLDATIRNLQNDIVTAGLDAATARVAVADATVKLEELESTFTTLAARASDNTDIAQLAENLTALGYDGPLAAQVRAWQQAAGLPVTGIVSPGQLVIATEPVHVATQGVAVGETLIASSPDRGAILGVSSIEKIVTVSLAVADQALAAVGRAVSITLPDDTDIAGTISEVGSVVTDGSITVTVSIADQAALGGLEVASVDVKFASDSRTDVLSAPIMALLARPEGGFAVELVKGGTSILVPVKTGLFAAGRVEISGEGIVAGAELEVPG